MADRAPRLDAAPMQDFREMAQECVSYRDRLAEAEATIARVEHLFAARPDTPCRTTWPDGIECVEVPMADLRVALDSPAGSCSHRFPDGTRCTLTDHSAPGLAEVHGSRHG